MLIDHQLGVAPTDVRGNPDPAVADAKHDSGHPIGLTATSRHDASGGTGAVLDRVLTELTDRHQDRVPNDGDIIEVVDQGVQQSVS